MTQLSQVRAKMTPSRIPPLSQGGKIWGYIGGPYLVHIWSISVSEVSIQDISGYPRSRFGTSQDIRGLDLGHLGYTRSRFRTSQDPRGPKCRHFGYLRYAKVLNDLLQHLVTPRDTIRDRIRIISGVILCHLVDAPNTQNTFFVKTRYARNTMEALCP